MNLRLLLFAFGISIYLFSGCSGKKTEESQEETVIEETVKEEEPYEYVDPGAVTDPESFKMDDAETFSDLIKKRKDLKTPESLIRLYYNYPAEELQSSVILTDSTELEENLFEITLVHDKLMDDSMRGIKLILTAEFKNGIWKVTEAKRNWRCWEGRGHEKWGIENCS